MDRRLFKDTLLQADFNASRSAFTAFHWRIAAVILLVTAVGHLVCGSVAAEDQMGSRTPVRRPGCLSSIVPLNRPWEEERNANINQEFNDYAAIYLDAFSAECKALAARTLAQKLEGTLIFGESGGTVRTPAGLEVHPFHNWLWGAAITHVFASALELRHNRVALREDLLGKTREIFESIPNAQDPNCAVPSNGCMDDYALTASGFGWIAAYEAAAGRNPQLYIDRAKELLTRMFQPMPVSGSVCYEVVGSNPLRCDGDPAGLASGRVRIIGIGHGRENPSYGLGLMTSAASTSLALYLAGQPSDFDTIDPSTGLTWKQISLHYSGMPEAGLDPILLFSRTIVWISRIPVALGWPVQTPTTTPQTCSLCTDSTPRSSVIILRISPLRSFVSITSTRTTNPAGKRLCLTGARSGVSTGLSSIIFSPTRLGPAAHLIHILGKFETRPISIRAGFTLVSFPFLPNSYDDRSGNDFLT